MSALPSPDHLERRLRDLLADMLVLDVAEVKAESLLLADLDIDSISLIELTFAIEREFGVAFPHLKATEETIRRAGSGMLRYAPRPAQNISSGNVRRSVMRSR